MKEEEGAGMLMLMLMIMLSSRGTTCEPLIVWQHDSHSPCEPSYLASAM